MGTDKGLSFRRPFTCLLMSGAIVLAIEYLESEAQEEMTELEGETQESSACRGYL